MKSHTRADRLLLFVVAAAAAAVLAGCGGGGGSKEATATSSAPAQMGPDALIGNYTTTLGPSGPDLKEPNPPGRWGLLITSETEAFFYPPQGPSFPNPIEISKDRIIFSPDPECPTQEGVPGEGTYKWRLSGDRLTFTEVKDTCGDRVFVLTSKPWTKTE